MQVLYTHHLNPIAEADVQPVELSASVPNAKAIKQGIKTLREEIDQSEGLFYTLLLYLVEIGFYVLTDAKERANKYLATKEDKNVNTKLADNSFLKSLVKKPGFQKTLSKQGLESQINKDWVKQLFKELSQTEAYQTYLQEEEPSPESDAKIIQYLWEEVMVNQEDFLNDLSNEWSNWTDDMELNGQLMENLFNNPKTFRFGHFISKEKWDYAQGLFTTVLEKNRYLMELILPKLQNWEADRVATVDMILLKMALSEILYFPTIPVKVSMNEYIELAKEYSTDQSSQFINGTIDNLYKELLQENKIRKIDHRQ